MVNQPYKYNESTQTWTKIPGIVSGSFHYRAQIGNQGAYRNGGVFGSYIEFDYFVPSTVTINKGDTLKYYQIVDVDEYFNDITPSALIPINDFYVVDVDEGFNTTHVVAYDTTIKLNTDYSRRLAELDSNWPLGFTITDLLLDVASVCGVTYIPNPSPESWEQYTLTHFYVDGITGRDIFAYASEIAGGSFICIYAGIITLTRPGQETSVYWGNPCKFLISPDEEDHTVYVGDEPYLERNVWFKLDSLTKKTPAAEYDGVRILWPNGGVKGYYNDVASPVNYYYVESNVLIDHLGYLAGESYADFARKLFARLNFAYYNGALAGRYDYVPTKVSLFPFRAPYRIGEMAYVLDPNGVITAFPIMSIDMSDSACVLEGYGHVDGDTDYAGDLSNAGFESTLQALTAQTNRIDDTINKAIIVKAYSKNVTISGNGSLAVTQTDLNISTITGYTPAGVVAYNTSNDNIYPRSLSMNATTATLVNKSGSSVTTTFWVYIMHVKSEMLEVQ